jgi:hypothetical protein
MIAVVATVLLFGALFVYGFPYVQGFSPLQRFTGSKIGTIALTGAFLLVVVLVSAKVLRMFRVSSAA